jgi:hypothetical protein
MFVQLCRWDLGAMIDNWQAMVDPEHTTHEAVIPLHAVVQAVAADRRSIFLDQVEGSRVKRVQSRTGK